MPDRLIGPLVISAAAVLSRGLDPSIRRAVPARLLHLAGGLRKFGAREQRLILTELGRHQQFTQLVQEVHAQSHSPCVAFYRNRSIGEILKTLEKGLDDADHVVCVLLASSRREDAAALISWVDAHAGSGPAGEAATTSRTQKGARTPRSEVLSRELDQERRLRKRAEAALRRALRSEESALRRAKEADIRARRALDELAALRSMIKELEAEASRLKGEVDVMSREGRMLLIERERLVQRWLRTRRELRLARSKLRKDGDPFAEVSLFEVTVPSRRPSLNELDEQYQRGGVSILLEAKTLLLLVDGWNVALNHIMAGNLRDRRLRLERTLAGYEARTGNRVLVVYDGREDVWSTMPQVRGVLRVFTPEEETADDYIVSELEIGTGGLAPVVATADWDLGRRCRKAGAFVVTSSELARFLKL